MRGATVGPGDIPAIEKPFQSTHPMRGATSNTPRPPIDHGISIHAPHAGRDQLFFPTLLLLSLFQSTRPVRGATLEQAGLECVLGISIHAPRAGRDSPWGWDRPCQRISIHAPRAGRDVHVRGALLLHEAFQSTRPVRGATAWDADQRKERYDFNPRAPCGARQPPRAAWRGGSRDFNPRAPCGARRW